jgi:hypothetical protein
VTAELAVITKLEASDGASSAPQLENEFTKYLAGFLMQSLTPTDRGGDLQKTFAIAMLALLGGAPNGVEGSYLVHTMNGRAIPAELRLPATAGSFRLFRLEQGLLRLGDHGRFTLYFRYYHQLVPRGGKPTSTPVMSESESGTFKVQAGNIVLTPAKKTGRKARPSITATIVGDEISASYLLQSGGSQQRVTLALRRDASYW